MIEPPFSDNEAARLEILAQYEIVDTEPELIFDDLTQLAADICGTPIALISLIDESRQWFKSKVGIETPSTPRNISFCGHAILQDALLEVHNASHDQRFSDNPLVTGEPNIQFYAGMPLTTESGHNLGTICVIDTVSRTLTSKQRDALKRIARQVISHIENRKNINNIKKLSDLLNEKIRFIQNVTDAIPASICYWDKNLTCQFANLAYKKLYGFDEKSIIGKSYREVVNNPKTIWQSYPRALIALSGKTQHFQVKWSFDDGSERHFEANYIPDTDIDGNITGFFSLISDITSFKLIAQEQKLATAVFENISEGIMITDANHIILTVNPSFCKMTGYTPEEVVGKPPRFLDPNDNNDEFQEILSSIIRDKFWVGYRNTCKKNRDLLYSRVRIDAVAGNDGNVMHYITAIVDYSKEYTSELELTWATNMLQRTGEMAKVGGWELDIATRTMKRSAEALKILELEPEILVPLQHAFDLCGHASQSLLTDTFNQCIEDGTPWDIVLPVTTAKGRNIWIHSQGERICEDGIPIKLVGAVQDITEQKNAEIYRLAQESEHKNALVREVHHRIKNNLQGITNLLFNFGVKYPALTDPLTVAAAQIQSVAVIHGLQGQHSNAKVELKNLLLSIAKNTESLWQINIHQHLPDSILPIYLADIESVPIALVINELVANAIKHNTQPDSIEIALSYDATRREAHILVSNQGQLSNQQSQNADFISGSGLKLIKALLPKEGTQFSLKQANNQVIAELIMTTPIIEL